MGQGAITESAGSNQLSRVGCAQGPSQVDPVARAVPPSLHSMPPEFQREVAYYDELQRRRDFEEFGVVFTTRSKVDGRSHDQESRQTQAISAESGPSLQGLRLRVPGSASQWLDEGRFVSGCKVNVESLSWGESEWVFERKSPRPCVS